MSDDTVLQRITAWEAGGLIDAETAFRLRAAEAAEAGVSPRGARTAIPSVFGPGLVITEVFGYLGAAFVLGAWHSLVTSLMPVETFDVVARNNVLRDVVQWIGAAIWLGALGFVLARRGERGRRAAGVAYLAATSHVLIGVQLALALDPAFQVTETLLAGAAGTLAALVFRRIQPALLTQLGLVVALVVLAFGSMQVLEDALFASVSGAGNDFTTRSLMAIGWWILVAVAFGLLARWEHGRAVAAPIPGDGAPGHRRAGMTRLAAGLTAVVGTAMGAFGAFGDRPFVPWLDDILVAAVSAVLLGLAIRSGAAAYLYPAALGLFIAFSDLNAQYVAAETGTAVALLVEGVILLGVGFGADRVRRRLEDRRASRAGVGESAPAGASTA